MGCPAVKMSSWDDEHDEDFMGKSGSRLIILILGWSFFVSIKGIGMDWIDRVIELYLGEHPKNAKVGMCGVAPFRSLQNGLDLQNDQDECTIMHLNQHGPPQIAILHPVGTSGVRKLKVGFRSSQVQMTHDILIQVAPWVTYQGRLRQAGPAVEPLSFPSNIRGISVLESYRGAQIFQHLGCQWVKPCQSFIFHQG